MIWFVPGIALYGGNPTLNKKNPMHSVVTLQLPIIQLRDTGPGVSVGYGATKSFGGRRTLAVVAGGYADGLSRVLSNTAEGVMVCGSGVVRVPLVGRISMDTCVFDITEVVKDVSVKVGDTIELLGDHISVDALAERANTIGYEVLTSLGSRYRRTYC